MTLRLKLHNFKMVLLFFASTSNKKCSNRNQINLRNIQHTDYGPPDFKKKFTQVFRSMKSSQTHLYIRTVHLRV